MVTVCISAARKSLNCAQGARIKALPCMACSHKPADRVQPSSRGAGMSCRPQPRLPAYLACQLDAASLLADATRVLTANR